MLYGNITWIHQISFKTDYVILLAIKAKFKNWNHIYRFGQLKD